MKKILLVLVLGLCCLTPNVYAASTEDMQASVSSFKAAFDITGDWAHSDGGWQQIFQDGKTVTMISVNEVYAQYMFGTYINPTTVKYIVMRKERATECITTLRATLKVESSTSVKINWVAQDASCDLTPGTKGSATLTRSY